MKVILAHISFKFSGGADVFFREVGRVLEEHGHEVAYFSTLDKENEESVYSKYFISAPDYKAKGFVNKTLQFCKIPYNFEARKQFSKLIDDFKPDLVHAFNIMTKISPSILDAAKKKGIPTIISCNDYKHICPNYKLFHHGRICEECKGGKFYNCLLNRCSHNSLTYSLASTVEAYIHRLIGVYSNKIDRYLFASDFMEEKTVEFWGRGFQHGKLLNPFKIPRREIQPHAGEYGLYFGRLIDEKGVDVLLRALTSAPDIPFKIVGDGPEKKTLVNMAKSLKLHNVEFTGPVWGEDMDEILKKAKFVVVPSLWHENFPYVILQSFAFMKPVIGSRRGGIPEMIAEDERGMLYPANDPEELSKCIKNLYYDDESCARMGTKGRQYLEDHFSEEIFYNELIQNYKAVLK